MWEKLNNIKNLFELKNFVYSVFNLSEKEKEKINKEFINLEIYETKFKVNIIEEIKKNKDKLNKKIYLFKLLNLIDDYVEEEYDTIETEFHPPDIDIDIADNIREKIIKEIETYYNNNIAIIGAYNTFVIKNSFQDIARVFDIDFQTSISISKKLTELNYKQIIIDIYNSNQKFRNSLEKARQHLISKGMQVDNILQLIFDFIEKINGNVRQLTEHAAGVLIYDDKIYHHIPVKKIESGKANYLTEFDLKAIEKINFLKIDLLALRTLSIIQDCINMIKEKSNKEIDLNNIDIEDENLYLLLNSPNLAGIFQFQTEGGRNILLQIKPKKFNDVVIATSLNRPATKNMVDDYINKKINIENEIVLKHTKETNYIIIFQEQVNKIIAEFLQIDEGEADLFRRQLEKIAKINDKEKYNEAVEKLFVEFMNKNENIEFDKIKEMFLYLLKYAGYLFNKSHAVAYSLITMQTVYLKTCYPQYFLCACLNNPAKDVKEKVFAELKSYNLELEFPDINYSHFSSYEIKNNKIYYSLGKIKNLTDETAEIIYNNKPYANFFDFIKKTYGNRRKLNIRKIEVLIKVNALRSFSTNCKALYETYMQVLEMLQKKKEITELFVEELLEKNEKEIVDYSKKLKEEFYLEYLDVFTNPLGSFYMEEEANRIREEGDILISLEDIDLNNLKKVYTTIFFIKNIIMTITKTGKEMCFLEVIDYYNNEKRITFFPEFYKRYRNVLEKDKIATCDVKVNIFNEMINFVFDDNFSILK